MKSVKKMTIDELIWNIDDIAKSLKNYPQSRNSTRYLDELDQVSTELRSRYEQLSMINRNKKLFQQINI